MNSDGGVDGDKLVIWMEFVRERKQKTNRGKENESRES